MDKLDIVRFKGGLGNQMFQYALLRALTQRGRDVRANLGFYRMHPELMRFCLTDVFPHIDIRFIEDEKFEQLNQSWREIKRQDEILKKYLSNYSGRFFWVEEPLGIYNEGVFETKNCAFVGYWQTEKYFKNIRNVLLEDFSFKHGDVKFEQLKRELGKNPQYVSVHIRRGDYLQNPEIYGNLAETNYYKEAMEYINAKVDNPVYVYFSDEIQWVKERFDYNNAIFIEDSMFDDYCMWYDMCLMSCCAHNILANSSFSWWGAWLNKNEDKIVVSPEIWFKNATMQDVWCDGWVKMPVRQRGE